MAEVTVKHELDCSIDEYWDKCVFDDAFNKTLYEERLHFTSFVPGGTADLGDRRTKKAKMEPPLHGVPGAVKKAIGDRLAYAEDGALDKRTGHYACTITPSTFADKTRVEAELWCEPSPTGDARKCVRFARVKVEVKVMLVGGLVEEDHARPARLVRRRGEARRRVGSPLGAGRDAPFYASLPRRSCIDGRPRAVYRARGRR